MAREPNGPKCDWFLVLVFFLQAPIRYSCGRPISLGKTWKIQFVWLHALVELESDLNTCNRPNVGKIKDVACMKNEIDPHLSSVLSPMLIKLMQPMFLFSLAYVLGFVWAWRQRFMLEPNTLKIKRCCIVRVWLSSNKITNHTRWKCFPPKETREETSANIGVSRALISLGFASHFGLFRFLRWEHLEARHFSRRARLPFIWTTSNVVRLVPLSHV